MLNLRMHNLKVRFYIFWKHCLLRVIMNCASEMKMSREAVSASGTDESFQMEIITMNMMGIRL